MKRKKPEAVGDLLNGMFEPRRCLGCKQVFAFQYQKQQYCEPCRARIWDVAKTQIYTWKSTVRKQQP